LIKEYLDKNNLKGKVRGVNFITLPNQGHGGIHNNLIFLEKLKDIL
jgi:hypothetical protein